MNGRRFKYRREDFGELPVDLNHLTIYLSFYEEHVEAVNRLEMTAKRDLQTIELDAKDLEVLSVDWRIDSSGSMSTYSPLIYEYDEKRDKLIVELPHTVKAGRRFCVRTWNLCTPSDHILEGIYRDTTPKGAPQQYMSQCQQWGFRRIMPIIDDCRAKCTMTTTLEGDSRYTRLISNGNVDFLVNPSGKPIPKPGNPARQLIVYHNPIPMAPYLFIACAGTWDTLEDEVVYEPGKKTRLEYLVPPGSTEGARIPMEILKESVLWIRGTQGYEYTGDTYRTICMTKSNFGGMENVGNTTIVTDAALINEHTLDSSLLYAHQVIVHEFEHNQCGSETTMETPFDVWLNEAYTVDVERRFMADLFDPDFIRLVQVDGIRNPLLGPLAIEDGGHAGRIVREGFNDPDELIDSVTYIKAAEVIRMLRIILGPDTFAAGKDLYFSRYRHGNANTDQFFKCFEEVSGRSLDRFKRGWLFRIGYPKVTAAGAHDERAGSYHIDFSQEVGDGEETFHLPIEVALVDGNGRDMEGTRRVFELNESKARLVFENVRERPAFASMNRGCSFYGTFAREGVSTADLIREIRLDPSSFNRVESMRRLTDQVRVGLLLNADNGIDPEWLSLYGEILAEESLPSAIAAYFLRIDEQPMDRAYCALYPDLVDVREKMMLAVNDAWRERIIERFERLDTYTPSPGRSPRNGIEDRMLKQVLLDLIAAVDEARSHEIILRHFREAVTANDRVSALLALNRSSAPERLGVLESVYEDWSGHLSGYANYLRIVASGTRDDVFDMIEREKKRPTFVITQPTWLRALFLPMATNNKMIWTDRGVTWIADAVTELAPINPVTSSRMLNTFQHVKLLKPELKSKVKKALKDIAQNVSEEISPTVHGQARTYLEGS